MNKLFCALTVSAFLFSCGEDDSHDDDHKETTHHNHDQGANPPSNGHQHVNAEGFVHSANHNFQVKASWHDSLKASGGQHDNMLTLHFQSIDGSDATSVEMVEFKPEMPMHGHGTNEANQVYTPKSEMIHMIDVTGIRFSMPGAEGAWVVHVKAKVNGTEDSFMLSVPQVHE